MEDYYDVVIVGAGPGGLNCAKHLQNSNLKILLLEQNSEIGPKVCAGGLSFSDVFYLNPPKSIIDKEFVVAYFNSPLQSVVLDAGRTTVYTVERKNLGQWQLSLINKNKVTIKTDARVTEITKDIILINETEKIKYKYLIGSDGSTSVVRKYLQIPVVDFGVGIQYLIPDKENRFKELEFFCNSKYFKGWYGWIFPHKGYVSIGTGSNPKYTSLKEIRTNLESWMTKRNINYKGCEFQAHGINIDYRGYHFGNVFLIGDAAGLASGFSGEGIHQALISGEEVAKEILNPNYTSIKIPHLAHKMGVHKKFSNFLTKSYFLRNLDFEIMALLLRWKWFAKKAIRYLL